ncbi:MAG: DUF302 domain-containing protein [Hydrogenophaga sp.]|uniref:DUF302 domain-containing protein n=1 Tax=Hydrogenophaga sp. TaxID=1904254 RepID=UPI00273593CA|nr:DUF302 domain-containing protein [Hydrogenophaga sp.]MDP3348285.1 DUF302 domain-containing protein [Hydrogenophaga sp.]
MNAPHPTVSPLRQRMLEDMRMRKLAPKTQTAYIRAVRRLAAYLHRPPDTATVEDLRNFQLHLVDEGTSPTTLNATITGLKFFCEITLDRAELTAKMQPVHVPRTLPVVLSREEVARLIAAAPNLKHQTALSLAYATGLRANEVVSLKVSDIDSQQAMKAKLGLDMLPYRILGACNPPLAHQALQAAPDIGLLLPCNVTVRQASHDMVVVGFLDPQVMVGLVEGTGIKAVSDAAEERLRRVCASLGGSEAKAV